MSIVKWTVTRLSVDTTRFVVESNLIPPPVQHPTIWFHWYVDGVYIGRTVVPEQIIVISGPGEQVFVECLDTGNPDFDPIANAPRGFPAKRRVYFRRSLDPGVEKYQLVLKRGTDLASSVGEVRHENRRWSYFWTTPRLEDLKTHEVSVQAVGQDGNIGDPSDAWLEYVVRTPDAPDWIASYDSGTGRVTFSEV